MAEILAEYNRENRSRLSPWEPFRDNYFYSKKDTRRRLTESYKSFKSGLAVSLAIMHRERNEIIGLCHFSNIIEGVFQACYLGFSVAGRYEGYGYASEALRGAIDYIFDERGLHRIMANYMPSNKRSAILLDRLGFKKEGVAPKYLKINGKWEDHVLTSLINLHRSH